MWEHRGDDPDLVTCIACGARVDRLDAREYDKYGDRWDREGKTFEHLCKPCYDECCHHPRGDLESMLIELDAGTVDRDQFLSWYVALVEQRSGQNGQIEE